MSATASTHTLAKDFAEMVRNGKSPEAIEKYYSQDIVSVEAMAGSPEMPQTMNGIEAIKGKNQWWYENNELHSMGVEGPYPHEDRFCMKYTIDVTPKAGPMAGQRIEMQEVALYTVNDGKIVKEEFFYDTGADCG